MNTKEYNGWTNYETWLAALWIGNEPYLDETVKEICAREFEYGIDRDDAVKEFMSDLVYEGVPEAGLASDFLGAALSEVDWREIVDHYVEDLETA